MSANIYSQLEEVVGKENFIQDEAELAAYFHKEQSTDGMVVVRPNGVEDLQKIMTLASDNGTPVYTLNDGRLESEWTLKEGIILDFCNMNKIEKLDPQNLTVRVQRGVTWEQLQKACAEAGVRVATPLAASSDSVLCNYVGRNIVKRSNRCPEVQATTLQAVLPGGRVYKSGSHALSEDVGPEWRDDGGPSLSRWFFGADDIFGVVSRASVYIYPSYEARDVMCFAFEDLPSVVNALRNIPRTELGMEYIAANAPQLRRLLNTKDGDLPPWTVIVGFEGRSNLVDYQKERVEEEMGKTGGRLYPHHDETMRTLIDQVWYRTSNLHTEFYAAPGRIVDFNDLISNHLSAKSVSSDSVGCLLSAFDRGRALWAAYDILDEDAANMQSMTELNLDLARKGAFFNRPQAKLADEIFSTVPQIKKQIRAIKGIMDSKFIINPGHIVTEDDQGYEFPTFSDEASEDLGITVSNIKKLKEKLAEALGEGWVSDNPADLNCYSRDFTITSGERPNIVVLPSTVDEVRAIIKLAGEHKVPLVPLSTGFNHGGLTLPRKGGILVDLKRMTRIVRTDEETMTATFEPGVRHRSLYLDMKQIKTYKDITLKPILSGTFGSVSVLSNYVSRGGAACVVKYGFNADLTVGMTWVLPNGELLKVGAPAFPGVGDLGLQFGMGPDIGGMFFNADGAFGICVEITTKLYPEMPAELFCLVAGMDEEALPRTMDALYEIARETLAEFTYKGHAAALAVSMAGMADGVSPRTVLDMGMVPEHPLLILLNGIDDGEVEVKKAALEDIVSRHNLLIIDPSMFGPEFAEVIDTVTLRAGLGISGNIFGAHIGSFQWTAGYFCLDQLDALTEDYEKLIQKYWKTSDPTISIEQAFTGTDIQGPVPYGRGGGIEFDFWWDPGNPEHVKRATKMLERTTELMFRHGGLPIRNMYGFGELLIPRLGVYTEVLKDMRQCFDPNNLMHPDVLPVTDDYV